MVRTSGRFRTFLVAISLRAIAGSAIDAGQGLLQVGSSRGRRFDKSQVSRCYSLFGALDALPSIALKRSVSPRHSTLRAICFPDAKIWECRVGLRSQIATSRTIQGS
jgi:hypothetical protein